MKFFFSQIWISSGSNRSLVVQIKSEKQPQLFSQQLIPIKLTFILGELNFGSILLSIKCFLLQHAYIMEIMFLSNVKRRIKNFNLGNQTRCRVRHVGQILCVSWRRESPGSRQQNDGWSDRHDFRAPHQPTRGPQDGR